MNAPGAEVELRNLTIRGLGTGSNGIKFDAGTALHIEHCVISGFTLRGVETQMTASANLYINDSSFRDCDSAVLTSTSSGTLKVAIDGTRAENMTNAAFYASDNSLVTVRNSVAAGVGSGFRGQINYATGCPSVLGVEVACYDPEFLDRIDIGPEHDRTVEARRARG